ncbi:reverse transcriptase domain-containing protein, partial [Tanacetum coccineum]
TVMSDSDESTVTYTEVSSPADRPEVTLPPRKRLGIALGPRYEVGESSSAAAARPARGLKADYGFVATMDREIRHDLERDLMAGRLNMLYRDRHAYAHTARLMKTKARMSREAWGRSMDVSDLARAEETDGDYRDAGGRSQETEVVHRGTESDEETTDSDGRKMAPKRTTRSTTVPETTNTTSVTNAQLQAMINQGVTAAVAARDANTNSVDNHNLGTGTEGVVELTQWIEKMENVFRIRNYFVENQIKFSTCTLLGNALTWWNSHVRTVGNDIAYAMTWTELKKKMTYKYCPRTEIKKLKVELWELKVKESDMGVMSSPNHPTSGIEDAFSSNFLDYISASPDYVLASPGKTYSSSSNNSFESPIPPPTIMPPSSMLSPIFNPQEFFLFEEILPLKKRVRDRSSSSTSVLPQEFEIGENSRLGKGRVIIQQDFDNLEAELRESHTQIAKLQRKQMGNNNKIALARFRIANLEQIIEDIQVRHQADKESLLNAIYEHKNSQEGPSDY